MYKAIITAIVVILGAAVTPVMAQDGMVKLKSNYSVEKTIDRLENVLTGNGLTIFRKVDHQEGAASAGMELPPTSVLIFGNPKLGTPLMQCVPTVAIDLPQKILIWRDQDGQVHVGYNSPDYLKKRHAIEGCDQELQKIARALKKNVQTAAGIN
ncbi:DUF302 domain-containing protein [Fodinibius sediminis]|uniref:Uncharacterized conserved protein, DUF302 family n=1 Tax=Fodinibius sediminis TaxID=1214077 RepID=A0A521CMW7_9BACT|nr:DUF302 domain-containing protein [Fodinibius sediminis]SMO60101.1 Uncharacterized conserved protein, DUF302 family [Fodinibius sediminis]